MSKKNKNKVFNSNDTIQEYIYVLLGAASNSIWI